MSIGKRIKAAREQKNMTLYEVSRGLEFESRHSDQKVPKTNGFRYFFFVLSPNKLFLFCLIFANFLLWPPG